MSERDDLLTSVAEQIKTYRQGEIPEPTQEHVDRWLRQFTPSQQLPFLREFDHVIKQTFLIKEAVDVFLCRLVKNEKLAGADPSTYWSSANLLNIQNNGNSQKEMLKIFSKRLKDEFGLDQDECGKIGGDFIYLDDVMFSGNRVGNDLEPWILRSAPQSATLHVIVIASHTSGFYLAHKKLQDAITKSGKNITIKWWNALKIENRKFCRDSSSVLWPTEVPDTPFVKDYIDRQKKHPFEPRNPTELKIQPFSSEEGRQVLEREFLIAGAKIIAACENPSQFMRPLGFSPFGVGFGSMIVTYRNCPNNCPLAMWWSVPNKRLHALHWYPLLPRKTYPTDTYYGQTHKRHYR